MQSRQSSSGLSGEPYAIGVDIGGTTLRCGLLSRRGRIRRGSLRQVQIDSKGRRETILRNFVHPLGVNLEQAKSQGLNLVGMGIGMCGPLDYENGICLIEGVDKYENLYGVNLKREFRSRLQLPEDFPIEFEVDAWSFARGEAWLGAARNSRRLVAITLGTGLGSAFLAEGKICTEGPGVPPPYGWIGQLPYQGGIVDDVISRRGILNLYHSLSKTPFDKNIDVKDIADLANQNCAPAVQTFHAFGRLLGKTLKPSLEKFGADCLVCGGRICLSFDLFAPELKLQLQNLQKLRKIFPAQSIHLATLRGAASRILTTD